jgi:hypothetical protein
MLSYRFWLEAFVCLFGFFLLLCLFMVCSSEIEADDNLNIIIDLVYKYHMIYLRRTKLLCGNKMWHVWTDIRKDMGKTKSLHCLTAGT